jgi:hypothetical protein
MTYQANPAVTLAYFFLLALLGYPPSLVDRLVHPVLCIVIGGDGLGLDHDTIYYLP